MSGSSPSPVTAGHWTPVLVQGLTVTLLCAYLRPTPPPWKQNPRFDPVSFHSVVKEGGPLLQVKTGFLHRGNCFKGVEAAGSVKPRSGQWDRGEVCWGEEFWKHFSSLIKREISPSFDAVVWGCDARSTGSHLAITVAQRRSRNAEACQGDRWEAQILDCTVVL